MLIQVYMSREVFCSCVLDVVDDFVACKDVVYLYASSLVCWWVCSRKLVKYVGQPKFYQFTKQSPIILSF